MACVRARLIVVGQKNNLSSKVFTYREFCTNKKRNPLLVKEESEKKERATTKLKTKEKNEIDFEKEAQAKNSRPKWDRWLKYEEERAESPSKSESFKGWFEDTKRTVMSSEEFIQREQEKRQREEEQRKDAEKREEFTTWYERLQNKYKPEPKPHKTDEGAFRVIVAGGRGFFGTHLINALKLNENNKIKIISRLKTPETITWEEIENKGLPPCDAIIDLAGKHGLTANRMVRAINRASNTPSVLITDKCFWRTTDVLDSFEKDLTKDHDIWREAIRDLDTRRGVRHVEMRVGYVLGPMELGGCFPVPKNQGILPRLRTPFCLGMGGYLGNGNQLFPWIHIDDAVGLFLKVLEDTSIYGIQNVVSPQKITNKKLFDQFAKLIDGKIRWNIPGWIVRLWLKEDAPLLLQGEAVSSPDIPYTFKFPTIDQALENLIRLPKTKEQQSK